MLLCSNTLLHIHPVPYIHVQELPSTTTDTHCWPLSSFTARALLIHSPSPVGFHSLPISLFQKPSCSHSKLVRRSYIKQRRWLTGRCALRLHGAVNWKSDFFFFRGARLKCGVLCVCDKDSGRWRDTGKARSEEGEERRGPPRAPACWVAIQRPQGVTDWRRSFVGPGEEAKLKRLLLETA